MDTTQYDNHAAAGGAVGIIFGLIFALVYLAILVVILAGAWKTFVKMGHPGWAGIVPVYNAYLIIEAIGKPIWWLVMLFIPCISIVFAVLILIEFAARFGKGVGFAIGLLILPFIFFPILGFGDAKYLGPKAPALTT
jgi:Family of unknown function (DUF5684)